MRNIRKISKKIYTLSEENCHPACIGLIAPSIYGNNIKWNSRNACWGCERAIQGKVFPIRPNYNTNEIHYDDGRVNCVPKVRRLHRLSN